MNTTDLRIPDLLRRHGLRPDKRLGQNFLIDHAALQKVVDAAEIDPGDQVLEIGAGLGSLTVLLAERARRVVAIELDERLLTPLREVLQQSVNVELVQGDILALNLANWLPSPGYLVVANIPYYITSALIRHLLETSSPPRRIVLTVQKEVAERICSGPGEMSLLALSIQVYGKPQICAAIPAVSFYPPPQVDSAVVRIDLFLEPFIAAEKLDRFFQLAKAGFSQKRKNLRNALAGGMRWQPDQAAAFLIRAGIDPQRRAETLSLDEWKVLTDQA